MASMVYVVMCNTSNAPNARVTTTCFVRLPQYSNVADPSNDLDALLSDKAEVETCIARIGDAVFSMEGCVERLEYATTATEDDCTLFLGGQSAF